uniref:Staygreen protein domain-containing protein n=1 Tax=Picea sitchensis TaxID=3332 RepID=A9NNY3_PICSI|nr:unknown [Picea sitchensis]
MAVARTFAERTQQCYSFPQSGVGISSASQNPQSQFKRKSKAKLSSRFLGSGSPWNALVAYQLQSNNRQRINSSVPRSTGRVVARLFGPAIFQASKLNVLFLGTHEEKHPGHLPRTYTLTHSDITAKITLAISQTINKDQLQGWYNRLQRDEVIAQWKKSQGKMSLHVHCHISGGHWLLDAIARLRFYIFRKELPVVLEAFRHGDRALLDKHPELETALVWVYFHSNVREFKRVECWGSLAEACKGAPSNLEKELDEEFNGEKLEMPSHCSEPCNCCFPPFSVLLRPEDAEQFI